MPEKVSSAIDICYLGCFTHSIDSQRRIAIPKDWRQQPSVEHPIFYLLPGRDHRIQVLPKELFENEIVRKLKKVSFASKENSQALARIGAKASHSSCDGQGRITLTQELIDHAELGEKAVLIGGITTIQIMTPECWSINEMSNDEMLDQIEKIQGDGEF